MKNWTKSRTIWLNVAALVASLASTVLLYVDKLGIDAATAAWIGLGASAVLAVANALLRLDTKTSIGGPK